MRSLGTGPRRLGGCGTKELGFPEGVVGHLGLRVSTVRAVGCNVEQLTTIMLSEVEVLTRMRRLMLLQINFRRLRRRRLTVLRIDLE